MTGQELRKRLDWENSLKVGDPVRVHWGYGAGFRACGHGIIAKVNPKSFRVQLTEIVRLNDSYSSEWPEGFVLLGIPRLAAFKRWHSDQAVYPESEATA